MPYPDYLSLYFYAWILRFVRGFSRVSVIVLSLLQIFLFCTSQAVASNELPVRLKPSGMRSITIAYPSHMMPLSYLNEHGEADGLVIAIWRLLSEQLKLPIHFIPMEEDAFIQQAAEGRLTAIALSSTHHHDLVDNSVVVAKLEQGILYSAGTFPDDPPASLENIQIGFVQGTGMVEELKANKFNNVKPYDSYASLVKAVARGEISVVAGPVSVLRYALATKHITSRFVSYPLLTFSPAVFRAGILKGSEEVYEIISQGMQALNSTDIKHVIDTKLSKMLDVQERGGLVIAIADDTYPVSMIDNRGLPTGLYVDVWRLWSKKTGIPIRFWSGTFQESFDAVVDGIVDVHSGLTVSKDRKKKLTFSNQSFYKIESRLFHLAADGFINSYDSLRGQKIGIIRGSFFYDFIKLWFSDFIISEYDSQEEVLEALIDKDVKAVVGQTIVIKSLVNRLGFDDKIISFPSSLIKKEILPAVKVGNENLISKIDKGMSAITAEEFAAIEKRWLLEESQRYYKFLTSVKLNLTHQEQEWLCEHPVINVVMHHSLPPVSFVDEQGVRSGLAIDYLNLIAEKLGVVFQIKSAGNWHDVLDMLHKKEVDMTPLAFLNEERAQHFNFTSSYLDIPTVLVTRNMGDVVYKLYDIAHKRIAVAPGLGIKSYLLSNYKDIIWMDISDQEAALRMVVADQLDGVILSAASASFYLSKLKFHNLAISSEPETLLRHRMAIRKDLPLLHTILNKALDSISIEEQKNIEECWIGEDIRSWPFGKDIVIGFFITFLLVGLIAYWNRRLAQEIKERMRIENMLRARAESDRVLSNITRQFMDRSLENAIQYTLQALNDFLFVHVTYITQYTRDINQVSVAYQWFRQNINSHIFSFSDLVKLIQSDYRSLTNSTFNGQVCQVHKDEIACLNSPILFQRMERLNVCSMIHVPMLLGGIAVGGIVQISLGEKRKWCVDEIILLRRAGELIAIAQSKKQAEDALRKSEERYQLAMDVALDGLWDWDIKRSTIYFSPRYFIMLGYKKNQLMSNPKEWQDLIHPSDMQTTVTYVKEQFNANHRFQCVYRIRRHDGNYAVVQMKGKVISRDNCGRAVRAVGTLTDVSEQRQRERALSMARFALDHSPDQVHWLNEQGLHRYVNKAFCEAVGYQQKELYTMSILDINPQLTVEGWCRCWLEVVQNKVLTFEALRKSKQGIVFPVEVTACYMEYEGKGYMFSSARNIADRKQSEIALNKAKEAADQANQAKSYFLANMSHEIRTPINAIVGLSQLVMKTPLSEKQRDYLTKINASADVLLHIINDILDFSKIEAGKLILENISFKLSAVLQHVYDLLALKANEKDTLFQCNIEPGVPDTLIGDPFRLGQILTNLANNAVKFTEHGRVTVLAEPLTVSNDTALISFKVIDTGIGIEKSKLPLLFESFSQVDGSTTRQFGGTGLGLAICKRLATMMGGDIKVNSELGSGSTFSIDLTFPLFLNDASAHTLSERSEGLPEHTETRVIRALVAEDNEINRQVATELLQAINVNVTLAKNGCEAVLMVKEKAAFDIIFMDIQMPELDGFEATEQIKRSEKGKNVPIVAMTAHAMAGDRERCLISGMDDHIAKPLSFHTLKQLISKLCTKGHQQSEDIDVLHSKKEELLLPSINMQKGLGNLLNDKELYLSLLKRFYQSNQGTIEKIDHAVERQEWDVVRHICHTLKGTAGTLGAVLVYEAAETIDKNSAVSEKDIARLKDALERVLKGLEKLSGNEVVEQEGTDFFVEKQQEGMTQKFISDNVSQQINIKNDGDTALSHEHLIEKVRELVEKLEHGDLTVMRDIAIIEPYLSAFSSVLSRIKRAMSLYNYSEAQILLSDLIDELECSAHSGRL